MRRGNSEEEEEEEEEIGREKGRIKRKEKRGEEKKFSPLVRIGRSSVEAAESDIRIHALG